MTTEDLSVSQILNRSFESNPGFEGEALRVTLSETFTAPTEADALTIEYPTDSSEVVKYRQGGVSGVVLRTLTITYEDDTKEKLLSVVVS